MGKNQKKLLHDARRIYKRDQYSKGRHVTFEEEEGEFEAEDEEYVSIIEDQIRIDVTKEKRHKREKKNPKKVSLLVDDRDITSIEENKITNRRKKLKFSHSEKTLTTMKFIVKTQKEARKSLHRELI